jgi:hypothetical protein
MISDFFDAESIAISITSSGLSLLSLNGLINRIGDVSIGSEVIPFNIDLPFHSSAESDTTIRYGGKIYMRGKALSAKKRKRRSYIFDYGEKLCC